MKRSYIKRKRVRRDWRDAQARVTLEGCCRGCGKTAEHLALMGRKLDCAHIIGRTFDVKRKNDIRYVHPLSTFPLCGPPTETGTCHNLYDGHELDMWDRLTFDERGWVIGRVGEGQARRRIQGRQ